MIINKLAKQKMNLLERTHPDLFASINAHFPNLGEEERGKIAGFVIEYVIKSQGNVDVFIGDVIPNVESSEWEGEF